MNEHVNGGDGGVTLSAADGAALDAVLAMRAGPALMRVGGDSDAVIDEARQARVRGWLGVLDGAKAPEASADLLKRTLAAVGEERMKLQPAPGIPLSHANEKTPRRRGTYLREIGAMCVAASLLVAVLIPAIGQARQSYRRTLCATNLASLGTAFGLYADTNNHALPSLAVSPDGNWLSPGASGHTNTANLSPLINASYISPARLICAGRGMPDGAVATATKSDIPDCSYSYVNLFGASRPTWNNDPGGIILADRNPLFAGPGTKNADANSFNHAQKGTYVLRADGHVTWETSPNVGPGGDNIWTVGGGTNRLMQYVGTEVPVSSRDVFLAP